MARKLNPRQITARGKSVNVDIELRDDGSALITGTYGSVSIEATKSFLPVNGTDIPTPTQISDSLNQYVNKVANMVAARAETLAQLDALT